ncbi:uncharacterized protein KY384_007943 [Bacidia gigantensis]|uniref:uncharacterized protein n=1 Tax=Bacidia gigantensis TaxID=2732470 RepID=UPI001D036C89|nr:uncharacterized protein KY384_007943 [Bacidia gigantensis]KAG8527789.1 hypothetical protein KY384_007943 [Bacidia gigantensis]
MALPWTNRWSNAQYFELNPPASQTSYDPCSSLLCLAIAIAAVANENFSWRLGQKNYQLIVLGFLLGIMQLCLTSITPAIFLLLEARFGSSSLQNYQGILRNQVLSSGLGYAWRVILALMIILPLGLSIAYKTFVGGQSMMTVNAKDYIKEASAASYYGMFAPPGLQLLGEKTGVSLFSNATIPYAVASSPPAGPEPPFPSGYQASGFNVLILSNESTALLDIPEPSYVSAVQSLLAGGESWNITASVSATIGTFNHSRTQDPKAFADFFDDLCEDAKDSSGAINHLSMLNNYAVDLIDHASPGDQSLQYVSLSPDPGITHQSSCSNLSNYVQPHDVTRQQCKGTWSITRGGIQLVDGSCDKGILPLEKQQPITNNTKGLFPGVWFMPSLAEFLGPFAVERNASVWKGSYLATSMAAMLWSRVTAANSAINLDPQSGSSVLQHEYHNYTYQDVGLYYPVDDHILYIRPTLRRSPWLYVVLAIQPVLTVGILALTLLLHSTPVDKDFGLISILAGVDRGSLDTLAGATLSGKLSKSVKLVMQPKVEIGAAKIEYSVLPASVAGRMKNGRLNPRTVYY